jgi:secondary thiamine-phosphate synthase enzyme
MDNAQEHVAGLGVRLPDVGLERIGQAGITAAVPLDQLTASLVQSDDVIVLVQNLELHFPDPEEKYPAIQALPQPPRFDRDGAMQQGRDMKSYRKELWFAANKRRELLNITGQVQEALRESGIREGLLLCNAMHITASVFINDDESGLHQDFEDWLEGLAPEKPYSRYRHNGYEDNADAHLKRTIMGREVVVAVSEGKLDFGPWEQIFYGEFDGKRRKRVLVKIIGE